jgi:ketosteroid isomerase-like protein
MMPRSTLLVGSFLMACSTLAPGDPAVALAITSREANDALMRGDAERYFSLVPLGPDFTLMSPFGGEPSHGVPDPERMAEIGRFFKDGSLQQEVVQTYSSPDMVVLAVIEHAHVAVADLPAQEWQLRVTLVYRRVGSEWQLVHRHADPLAHGVTVEQAAALGRGDAVARSRV